LFFSSASTKIIIGNCINADDDFYMYCFCSVCNLNIHLLFFFEFYCDKAKDFSEILGIRTGIQRPKNERYPLCSVLIFRQKQFSSVAS
jgi:hypothetical protein